MGRERFVFMHWISGVFTCKSMHAETENLVINGDVSRSSPFFKEDEL